MGLPRVVPLLVEVVDQLPAVNLKIERVKVENIEDVVDERVAAVVRGGQAAFLLFACVFDCVGHRIAVVIGAEQLAIEQHLAD